ncbi:MAG: oligosaccharide flippase family protein [Sarcina sp.]
MKEKSLYKNSIFRLILNIFNIILPIFVGPYVMRILLPVDLGYWNYSQTIYGYFFMFAAFGILQYGVREVARVKHDKSKLSSEFTSLFIITTASNLIMFAVFFVVIKLTMTGDQIYWICMLLNVQMLFNIFQIDWMNTALENFGFITLKTVIIKTLYFVLIIALIRTPQDFDRYVIISVFINSLANIVSFVYIKRTIKFSFKNLKFKKHLIPMLLVVIISNANVLYTQADKYVLGFALGGIILNYYVIGQSMMTVINTFLMSVIQAIAPRLHTYFAKEDKTEYIALLNKVTKLYFMLIFPAVVGMILFSQTILTIYAGSQYGDGQGIVGWFGIYMITLAFDEIASNQVIYVHGKEGKQVRMLFVGGIVNVILNFTLMKLGYLSADTAILCTAIANVVVLVYQYFYIKNVLKLKINLYGVAIYKYLGYSLLFIPIVYFVRLLNLEKFLELIVSMIICGSLYFGILVLTRDESFYILLNPILNKVKRVIGR